MSHAHHHHPPKAFLVERVAGVAPGHALDVGCGPGIDALWLASRGWTVTALEIAPAMLARARASDPEHRVTWIEGDFLTWPAPDQAFDLVTAHFVHVPLDARRTFFAKLARAVRPGGVLGFASHHPSDIERNVPRPAGADLYFTADEVASYLPGRWEWLEKGTRPGHAHDRERRPIDVLETVLYARRMD